MSELHRRIRALEQRAGQDHQEVSDEELIDVFSRGNFQGHHLDAMLEAIYLPLGASIVGFACFWRRRRLEGNGTEWGYGPMQWTAEMLSFTPDEPPSDCARAGLSDLSGPIGKPEPGKKRKMTIKFSARLWLAERFVRIEGVESLQQQIADVDAARDRSFLLIPQLDRAEAKRLLRLVEPLHDGLDGPLLTWIAAENRQEWTSLDKRGRPVEGVFATGPVSEGFQGFFEIEP